MTLSVDANIRALRKVVAVLTAIVAAASAADEPSQKPFSRAEAAKIIAEARRIVDPGGVERLENLEIGSLNA